MRATRQVLLAAATLLLIGSIASEIDRTTGALGVRPDGGAGTDAAKGRRTGAKP
jgi:hypothetical protein